MNYTRKEFWEDSMYSLGESRLSWRTVQMMTLKKMKEEWVVGVQKSIDLTRSYLGGHMLNSQNLHAHGVYIKIPKSDKWLLN
jgi:hypothetical protein